MWTDLSSAELRSRLINRGMHPDWVYGLVSNRDRDAEAVWVIEKVLNGAPFMEIPEGVLIGIGRGP